MKASNNELQRKAFEIAKEQYETLLDYNNSEEEKLARMAEVNNTYRLITFIEELLLYAMTYLVSSEETAKDLINFAVQAEKNGYTCIVELIASQIDQSEIAVDFAKDWAEEQIKKYIKEFHQSQGVLWKY